MENLSPYLDIVTTCLNLFSILVLIWGVIEAAYGFFIKRFKDKTTTEPQAKRIIRIKNTLGGYVLLSLEILIAADIISSILKPTMEDIIKLAAIVAIRTVISFFLNREIKDQNEEDNK